MQWIRTFVSGLFCLIPILGVAQEKDWSETVELEHQLPKPHILEKSKTGYYAYTVFKRRRTYLALFHYDHSLKIRAEKRMELPPKADFVGSYLIAGKIMVVYLEKSGRQSKVLATVFDENFEPLVMHRELAQFPIQNPTWKAKAADSALHMVIKRNKDSSLLYLKADADNGLLQKTRGTWKSPSGNLTLDGMAVQNQSIAVLLKSKKDGLYCLLHQPEANESKLKALSKEDHLVTEALIEEDQLREAFVINGLYKTSRKDKGYDGITFHVFSKDRLLQSSHQAFPTEFIQKFYGKNTRKQSLKNLSPRKVIPRSDGGTVFLMEEMDSETQVYRDFGYYGFQPSTTKEVFYYENIGILALSSEGQIEWNKIHRKSQTAINTPPLFASFSSHITRKAIILLYNQNSGSNHDLLYYALKPSGNLTGNLLLKGSDSNASTAANYAKQVAHNEVIVPAFIDQEKFLILRIKT